jgi:hypothetical protein
MELGRFFSTRVNRGRYKQQGVRAEEIVRAAWSKSSRSAYNGSCIEVARLRSDRVGIRDTKEQGAGPALIFNQDEWAAFLEGAKAGEFDSI